MLKGLAIGVVIGAVLAAAALKAVSAARAGGGGAAAGGSAGPAAGEDPGRLRAELERLKGSNDALRQAIGARTKELEAASKQPAGGGRSKAAASWRDLAPKLLKAVGAFQGGKKGDQAAAQAAMLEMFSMLGKLAKEYGVGMEEAMATPDGLPAMLREILDASETPLSPAQRAELEALIAKYGEDWAAYVAAKATRSKLEQKLALGDLTGGFEWSLKQFLTDEQKKTTQQMAGFSMMGGAMGGGMHFAQGTRDEVSANLTDHWIKTLKLEESQKSAVAPIVDEFIKEFQNAGLAGMNGTNPEDFDFRKIQAEQLRAQIRAQQKMAGALSLSAEQREALKNWGTQYSFWVNDGKATVPAPDDDGTNGEGE